MTPGPWATTSRGVALRARAELDAGRPVVLVTLVGREGPAYRRPGAHLLVGDEGPLAGLISGGCVEDEVAARVRDLPPGATRELRIDTSGDEIDGLGVGCGGALHLIAESVAAADTASAGARAWLVAVADGLPVRRRLGRAGTADVDVGGLAEAWPHDVHARLRPARNGWLETTPTPPRLTVVGTGPEAEPLVARALRLGWRVRVAASSARALAALAATAPSGADLVTRACGPAAFLPDDTRRAPAGWEVGPSDRIVAASRRLDLDAAAVAWALRGGARFVGVVAGAERMRTLAARPELAGLDAGRVEAPVGAPIGAEGHEEVATAIAARLVADLRAAAAPTWAVVPAAGAGRRLGARTPKPLLRRGDETLLSRALDAAEAACDGTIVVVGHEAQRVAATLDPSVRVVRAEAWRDGLAASLRAGLAALPTGARALVTLPDMPGVDARHVTAVRRAGATAAGAASRYPDGRLGAPALLPTDMVDAATQGGGSMDQAGGGAVDGVDDGRGRDEGFGPALQARRDVAAVPLPDASDVDTRADAEHLGWRVPT